MRHSADAQGSSGDASRSQSYRLLELTEFEFAFPVAEQERDQARRRFLTLLVDPSQERSQGTTGYVRKAFDLSRTHTFAIKGLLKGTDKTSACDEAALREEYKAQLRLSQLRGFPRLYGTGQSPDGPVIVMEWIEGKSLRQAEGELLAQAKDRFELAAQLGHDLYAILAGMGVLSTTMAHRDLSPSNVMIKTGEHGITEQADRGRFDLCIVDFGSTTFLDEYDPRFTVNTSILRHGTPEYAPPEMLADSGEGILELRQSPAIDVYAAAGILYEVASGRTPYQLASHPGEVPYDIKTQGPPPALAAPGHEALCEAVMQALSPQQGQRPTAAQMRDACAADIHDATAQETIWRSTQTEPLSPFKAQVASGSRSVTSASNARPAPTAHAMTRRQLVAIGAVGTAAAAAVGLGAFALGRSMHREDEVFPGASAAAPQPGKAAYCAKDAGSGLWGYLDAQREWVVTPRFAEAPRLFSEDLAAAADPDTGLWGYLDTAGNWSIRPAFDAAGDFSEGYAFAYRRAANGDDEHFGWIDAEGAWSITLSPEDGATFVSGGAFFSGLAPLALGADGLYGYMGTDGTWAIAPVFRSALAFGDGDLACATDQDGNVGWIGKDGSWVIDPGNWAEARTFHEGRAAVADQESGLWGFIDSSGTLAVSNGFAQTRDFHGELAAAQDEATQLWGYIDAQGAWAIDPTFASAGDFAHGLAPAQDVATGLFGYIDDTGAWVFSPEFADANFGTRARGVEVTLA